MGNERWYVSEGDGVPWVVILDEGGMHHVVAECGERVHADEIARALNNQGAVEERDELLCEIRAALVVDSEPHWSGRRAVAIIDRALEGRR